MLKWRARGNAMRDGFADCLMGLSIREEVEDLNLTAEPEKTNTSFLDDAVLEGQPALPAPSEQSMEMTIPQTPNSDNIPVAVEQTETSSTTVEPITVSRVTPETSVPDVPSVEIYKPLGARLPNWKRTREALCTIFQTLETTALCAAFRAKNSGTINQLRDHAKFEWEIWKEVSASYEFTIFEREQAATGNNRIADADQAAATV